jgi:hypothetical protein
MYELFEIAMSELFSATDFAHFYMILQNSSLTRSITVPTNFELLWKWWQLLFKCWALLLFKTFKIAKSRKLALLPSLGGMISMEINVVGKLSRPRLFSNWGWIIALLRGQVRGLLHYPLTVKYCPKYYLYKQFIKFLSSCEICSCKLVYLFYRPHKHLSFKLCWLLEHFLRSKCSFCGTLQNKIVIISSFLFYYAKNVPANQRK